MPNKPTLLAPDLLLVSFIMNDNLNSPSPMVRRKLGLRV